MKPGIFYDDTPYRLKGVKKKKKILNEVIRARGYLPGDLSFIFTNDERVLGINKEFLNHDYYTDVITFDYCIDRIINGEIYMSVDRIRENARNYKVSLDDEVMRVMIHGVLHLAGMNDVSTNEQMRMRKEEDKWLRIYKTK